MIRVTYALLAGAWLFLAIGAVAKESTETVDPKYTWDLSEIYPSVEAWNQAREDVLQDFVELEERRGKSADSLYTGMQMYSDAYRNAARGRLRLPLSTPPERRCGHGQT